jgi:hypothetical protein
MKEELKYKLFDQGDCISEKTMFMYIDGQLDPAGQHLVERHLLDCELCSDALEGLRLVKDRGRISAIRQAVVTPVRSKRNTFISIAAAVALLAIGIFLFDTISSNHLEEAKVAEIQLPPTPAEISKPREDYSRAQDEKALETVAEVNTETKTGAENIIVVQEPQASVKGSAVVADDLADNKSALAEESVSYNMTDSEEPAKISPASTVLSSPQPDMTTVFSSTASQQQVPVVTDILSKKDSKDRNEKKKNSAENRSASPTSPAKPEDDKDYDLAQNTSDKLEAAGSKEQAEVVVSEKESANQSLPQPQFPGGDSAMVTFIRKNIQIPQDKKDGSRPRCFVEVTVSAKGSITDVKVLRNIDPQIDKEIIRVFKMMPAWKYGKSETPAPSVKRIVSFPLDLR